MNIRRTKLVKYPSNLNYALSQSRSVINHALISDKEALPYSAP